ncbi:MAG: glycosyltransferase family 2 protein, partial [Elusimicrobiota bacterium]
MLSVVLPVYNEEPIIRPLYAALARSLSALGLPWEIVFVDDGSRDGSGALLAGLAQEDPRVKLVSLSRNFGNQLAIARGMEFAAGDWVVTMDSDLEDKPEDIAKLYAQAQEGFDVVYAVRSSAQKTWIKDLCSRAFYLIIDKISDTPLPRNVGNFCIMDRAVVEALKSLPERHRYFAGLRAWVGFRQIGL